MMNVVKSAAIDLRAILPQAQVQDVLDALDRDLVGLAPVKRHIREIAALLIVSRARRAAWRAARPRCTWASPAIPAPARPRWR